MLLLPERNEGMEISESQRERQGYNRMVLPSHPRLRFQAQSCPVSATRKCFYHISLYHVRIHLFPVTELLHPRKTDPYTCTIELPLRAIAVQLDRGSLVTLRIRDTCPHVYDELWSFFMVLRAYVALPNLSRRSPSSKFSLSMILACDASQNQESVT